MKDISFTLVFALATLFAIGQEEAKPYKFEAPQLLVKMDFLKQQRSVFKELGVVTVTVKKGYTYECLYQIDTASGRATQAECFKVDSASQYKADVADKVVSWKLDSAGRAIGRKDSTSEKSVMRLIKFDSLSRVQSVFVLEQESNENGMGRKKITEFKQVNSDSNFVELSGPDGNVRIDSKNEVVFVKEGADTDSLAYEYREDSSYTVEYWKLHGDDSLFTIGREDLYKKDRLVSSTNYVHSKEHWKGKEFDVNWAIQRSIVDCYYDGEGRLLRLRATGVTNGEKNYIYGENGLLTKVTYQAGEVSKEVTYTYTFK